MFFTWKLKPTQKQDFNPDQTNLFGTKPADDARAARELRVEYSIPSDRFAADAIYLPKDKSVALDGALREAAFGSCFDADAELDLGPSRGRFRVMAVPLYTPVENRPLSPVGRGVGGEGRSRRRLLVAAALGLLLLAGAAAAYQLIFRTPHGTLIVEVNDKEVEARFKNGELRLYDAKGELKYTLKPSERNKDLPPGKYKIEVAGVDGLKVETERFEMTNGKEVTVTVRMEGPAVADKDADRKAAEWVLAVGGDVLVVDAKAHYSLVAASSNIELGNIQSGFGLMLRREGKELPPLTPQKDLPSDSFRLIGAFLSNNQKVDDAGLRSLSGAEGLLSLLLDGTRVTNSALAELPTKELLYLRLYGTKISDEGLAHLKRFRKLFGVELQGLPITDAGLAHLAELENLEHLYPGAPAIGDVGVGHLRKLRKLTRLDLGGTKVTDAGLVHVKGFSELTLLRLHGIQLSDACLEHLQDLRKLERLELHGTQVTPAAIAALQKALPKCDIYPTPDRRGAEWWLSVGGWIHIIDATGKKAVTTPKDLPASQFQLVYVDLKDTKVTDDDLVHLKPFTLTGVQLGGTQVTDAGLVHLKHLKDPTDVVLYGTRITDAGLAHLQYFENLKHLDIHGTQVTGVGLDHLKGLKHLVTLQLQGTAVTDAGLAHVKGHRNLTLLNLGGTRVTDVGLAHLTELSNLTVLGLIGTRVSDAGLVRLKGLKVARLDLRDTLVTDAGLAHLGELKNLTSLALGDTQITDAGLAQIEQFKGLTLLDLQGGGKFTNAGIVALQKALPRCRINTGDADRDAALWALAAGGNVEVVLAGDENLARIKAPKELPTAPFQLRSVDLSQIEVSDSDLARVGALANLTALTLGKGITDAGLEHFKGLPKLTTLALQGADVTDAGLLQMRALTNLMKLDVTATKVTAAGVAALQKALPKCEILGGPVK